MLRFLIFFILITASFAGGLMLAIHYKGRGMEDTPFIADFRKRYEINPQDRTIIYSLMTDSCFYKDFKIPCTKKDVNTLKRQGENGDLFSRCAYFSIAPYLELMTFEKSDEEMIKTALSGESYCIFGTKNMIKDLNSENFKALDAAAYKGDIISSIVASSSYATENDNENFCRIMNNLYDRYGIEGISPFFYIKNYKYKAEKYFKYCTKLKPDELLSQDTPEVSLIKGYREYSEGRYKQAADIFESIADLDNKIGYNATQCLGVMHYKGNGVDKDEKKGIEMVNESFEKGVLCKTPLVQLMPDSYKLNNYHSYPSVCCRDITPEDIGGNL